MAWKRFGAVAERISPSEREKRVEREFAKGVISRIKKAAPKKADVVLVGSVAKGTFLKESRDIDIFILLPTTFPKKTFVGLLERLMKKAFAGTGYALSYAEHPYARFHFKGRKIDLVPAYRIKKTSERMSAVDRSFFHTRFVLRKLDRKKIPHVLLLKKFLRANSLYGAEIKIKGFSGYLCELMIIRYGSFSRLLKAAAGWKFPVFLQLKNEYGKKAERETALEKFNSCFVFIDPTDRNRNVSAALSEKNIKRFISLAKRFLKGPSERYFFRTPPSFEQKVERAGKVLLLEVPKPKVVDEVLWGQLHRLTRMLSKELAEFSPGEPFADDEGKVRIAIPVKKTVLPKTELLEGPPVEMEKHARTFRKMHRGSKFIRKKGRVYAKRKRKVRKITELVKNFYKKYSKTGSHLAYPVSRARISVV